MEDTTNTFVEVPVLDSSTARSHIKEQTSEMSVKSTDTHNQSSDCDDDDDDDSVVSLADEVDVCSRTRHGFTLNVDANVDVVSSCSSSSDTDACQEDDSETSSFNNNSTTIPSGSDIDPKESTCVTASDDDDDNNNSVLGMSTRLENDKNSNELPQEVIISLAPCHDVLHDDDDDEKNVAHIPNCAESENLVPAERSTRDENDGNNVPIIIPMPVKDGSKESHHPDESKQKGIQETPESASRKQTCMTTSENTTLSLSNEPPSNREKEKSSLRKDELRDGTYSIEIEPSEDHHDDDDSSSSFSSSEYSLDSQIESAYTEDFENDSTAASTDSEECSLPSQLSGVGDDASVCGSDAYINYWKTKFVYPKTIPSPSASYSVVSLSYLEPKIPTGIAARVFEESMRILKPGGLLYVVDVDGLTVNKVPKLRQMVSRLTEPGVRHKVHEIQTKQILQTNGFVADGLSNESVKIVRWIGFKPKQSNASRGEGGECRTRSCT